MRDAQLHARIHAPALTSQPLAIQEVGTAELDGDTSPAEPIDRFHVQNLGPRTIG